MGQAEVSEPKSGVLTHDEQHVAWLDVAVQHAASMGVREGTQQSPQGEGYLAPAELALGLGERASEGPLHHEVRAAGQDLPAGGSGGGLIHLAVVEDPNDVRVIQACDGPYLAAERGAHPLC